jgi:hypothetical protein
VGIGVMLGIFKVGDLEGVEMNMGERFGELGVDNMLTIYFDLRRKRNQDVTFLLCFELN